MTVIDTQALMAQINQPIDFRQSSFLVIDDITAMANFLRITITTFGGVSIDLAGSAADAFNRLNNRVYNVILCDYDLGPGKDGQLLLEEMKRRKMLPNQTIFMMVTAEQRYEQVASAVELVPDDYLIKPFSGETLKVRLERQVRKKLFLAPVFQAQEQQDYPGALDCIEQLRQIESPYGIDLLRLKAETLGKMGQYDAAIAVYEEVLVLREIPWAKMGKGKMLYFKTHYPESAELFAQVIAEAPDYLEAYDWLARAQIASGDWLTAQQTMQSAVSRSPRTMHRRRSLGKTALQNGDLDTAESNFQALLDIGRYSSFLGAQDFADLSRVHLNKGEFSEALAVMAKAPKILIDHQDEAQLYTAVMSTLIHEASGNKENAKQFYAKVKGFLGKMLSGLPTELALEAVQAALKMGDVETGRQLTRDLIQNNHDDPQILQAAEKLFAEAGIADVGRELIKSSSREMILLNNKAVELSKKGDLRGAVDLLLKAAHELPGNLVISFNAAQAIIALLERKGWEADLAKYAEEFLIRVRNKNPDDNRVGKLIARLRKIPTPAAA